MKIFYYEPIIKPIAGNGSERLGVKAYTKIWAENSFLKIEIEMGGTSTENALQKLNSFITSGNKYETIELPCNYYLCSNAVIEKFKPFEVSKPFKSGYEYEKDENYFVAWLNFEEVEKHYNEVIEPYNESLIGGHEIYFSAHELVPGQMDVSKISLKDAKKEGLMVEIWRKLSFSKESNVAMTIYNLANQRGITPIQLIEKIA